MEQLKLRLTIFQIMAKHKQHVKNIMLRTCELNKDMFLTKQNVRVLFGKVARETYQLHKNDAKNVNTWVQQNTNSMFYYQETRVEVDGGFIGQNMFLTLGTQTPWQREMMIEYGHQGRVIVDATFATNEKKVIHYVWYIIMHMWSNALVYM